MWDALILGLAAIIHGKSVHIFGRRGLIGSWIADLSLVWFEHSSLGSENLNVWEGSF